MVRFLPISVTAAQAARPGNRLSKGRVSRLHRIMTKSPQLLAPTIHFEEYCPGKKRAAHMGRKSTTARRPMERKPQVRMAD